METKNNSRLSATKTQSGDHSQNNSSRCHWPALTLGGLLFVFVFALSALSVKAECQQWNVGHKWRFRQGSRVVNEKTITTTVDMNLQQKGAVLTGTANLQDTYPADGRVYVLWKVSGMVDGTVEGNQFAVTIEWNNGTTGVYEGTIGPSGKIEGKGWERRSPRTKTRWFSETRMVCADSAAVQQPAPAPQTSGTVPAPAPVVRPVKSTGRPKTSVATPFIKANPVAVTIPAGQSRGTTTLTWDGGPDHPEVEVWLRESLGGNTEALLVRQGKGTRNVPVELGKYYHFILKDAGQELAKAVVLTRQ